MGYSCHRYLDDSQGCTCLAFFGTSDGGCQAKQDVDAAGDIAANLLEPHTASEYLPDRRTQQGIETIGATGKHPKSNA